MMRVKKVVTVLRRGEYTDSASEQSRYWITRPPAERVAFARELMRSSYRRLHGRPLPGIQKIARRIPRA